MTNSNKPTTLYWIIAVVALLWNGMGANAYIQQAYKTDAFKAMYSDEKVLEMVSNTPAWAMGAFALAVFGGVLGSILLLLRKKAAKPVFMISLLGIIVQMVYNLFISKALEVYGPGAVIMPIMVLVFGAFLVWYTQKAEAKGWLS
jgi:small basic protein